MPTSAAEIEPSYEDVAYPGVAVAAMHPGWLASLAWLHGLAMAQVAQARVVEFGCGDGATLIALALAMPQATFVGVDLSAAHVARGRARAQALGLANLDLVVGDIVGFDAGAARFDFMLAHGVYSWVPRAVRAALLRHYGALLADDGVGYLSFGALPGGHLDDAVYGMVRFHAGRAPPGRPRIAATRDLLRMLLDAVPADDRAWSILRGRMRQLVEWPDATIAHDVLSDSCESVWLHEVAAALDAVGLQVVADARLVPGIELAAYPRLGAFLDLAGDEPLARAQYLDMARLARFRQVAVVRKGRAPAAAPLAARVGAVRLRGLLAVKDGALSLARGVAVTFSSARGLDVSLDDPLAKAALAAITAAAPHGLTLDDIVPASVALLRQAGFATEIGSDPRAHLAGALARLVGFDLLQAACGSPPPVAGPAARPLASALARLQAAAGEPATTPWLESFRLDAEEARLLPLLDGTRDRAQLAAALGVNAATVDRRLGLLYRRGFLVGERPMDDPSRPLLR